MIFNSFEFALFLPIVFILYWFVVKESTRWQNLLLLLASYFFYGWWDWKFLSLILFSSVVDFFVAKKLSVTQNIVQRKVLLFISVAVNLGLLGFFKYYNFFIENFITAFSFFGVKHNISSLQIILPVGISFYTFQTMSYTIDIYRGKLKATNNFIAFSTFVSFFPQLVAGPIERATHLLPQFYAKRKFDYVKAVSGMRQILWGLFKKIVIADNCAEYADLIFNNSVDYPGSVLLIGAVFFTFQIYGDFSGYSDIAIGTSRLFGFDLMKNFSFPYFSRDIAEFWRRWHISLSTWFRDYLYIPLGGSKGSTLKKIRNTFIIFIVSGFWHGANWTFIVWGALNAIYFLPLLLRKRNRNNLSVVAENSVLPSFKELTSMALTFSLTVLAWVFFRANSVHHALSYLSEIASFSLFSLPQGYYFTGLIHPVTISVIILVFMVIEWTGRKGEFAIDKTNVVVINSYSYIFYFLIVFAIMIFGKFNANQFIYFQF